MQFHGLAASDYMIPEMDPNYLGGLGISEEELAAIGENMAGDESLSAVDVANALRPFSKEERKVILGAFLANDIDGEAPSIVGSALSILQRENAAPIGSGGSSGLRIAWALLGTASMAASAYHGYRRNQSVGWAVWWALMGGVFPVFTPVVAVAQGFGKAK